MVIFCFPPFLPWPSLTSDLHSSSCQLSVPAGSSPPPPCHPTPSSLLPFLFSVSLCIAPFGCYIFSHPLVLFLSPPDIYFLQLVYLLRLIFLPFGQVVFFYSFYFIFPVVDILTTAFPLIYFLFLLHTSTMSSLKDILGDYEDDYHQPSYSLSSPISISPYPRPFPYPVHPLPFSSLVSLRPSRFIFNPCVTTSTQLHLYLLHHHHHPLLTGL